MYFTVSTVKINLHKILFVDNVVISQTFSEQGMFFTPSQPHAQFSSTFLHDRKGSDKHSGKHPNNVAVEVKIF